MKSIIKNIAIATSLCTALFVVSTSHAEQINTDSADDLVSQTEEQPSKMGKRLAKLTKKLGLSESQQAAVIKLKMEIHAQLIVFKPEMKAYKEQVRTLISAEYFDEAAFIQLRESHNESFNSMALIKAKSKAAMKKILTPAQLEKYKKMQKKNFRKNRRQ